MSGYDVHLTNLFHYVNVRSSILRSYGLKPFFHLANLFARTEKKVGTVPTCSRRIFSPTNVHQSRCRILVFASRRANKVAKWKIGFSPFSVYGIEGISCAFIPGNSKLDYNETWPPPSLKPNCLSIDYSELYKYWNNNSS